MEMREKLQTISLFLAANPTPPIKVVNLANALGIRVYDTDWPSTISGKIMKHKDKGGDSGFAIFVNKNHPNTRQRFTIAHEIAHYVLHEEQIGDGVFDDALYRSGLSNEIERQANGLAADILMPRSILNAYAPTSTEEIEESVDRLADLFQVSRQAMSIRLGVYA